MSQSYVSYLRVSTQQQGKSGLGIEAQRKAVDDLMAAKDGVVKQEFVEVESGANNDRPRLAEALAMCRLYDIPLVVAKLDRLARSAAFLTTLQESRTRFVCCDFPEADEFLVGVMALLARWERKKISERTKAALDAKTARGEVINRHRPAKGTGISEEMRQKGREVRQANAEARAEQYRSLLAGLAGEGITTLRGIAQILEHREVPNPSGTSTKWTPVQVKRIKERLDG